MNYLVARKHDCFDEVRCEIDKKDVERFLKCRATLEKYLLQEMFYDQVVEAYWDYKNKLNYWAVRFVSFPCVDYGLNHEVRSSLNRLALNVLNLGKFYLDRHYFGEGKKCFARDVGGASVDGIVEQRDRLHRENKGYAIGCKLRNGGQHQDFVADRIFTHSRLDQKNCEVVFSFGIKYTRAELAGLLKGNVDLNEDEYFLTDILDGYVCAISQMHMLNRKLTDRAVVESKMAIAALEGKCILQEKAGEYLFEIECENGSREGMGIEWFSVVDYLHKKHSNLINYSNISFNGF